MYSTIIKNEDNQDELVKKAILLGYSKIYFLSDKARTQKSELESLSIKYNVVINQIVICNSKNCSQYKKQGFLTLIESPGREVFEQIKPSIISRLEDIERKDSIHQRVSGLNQILCGLAKKNNISILFDVSKITSGQILGRIKQNVSLARKYKLNILIANVCSRPEQIKSPRDIISLGTILGLSPLEAKKAVSFSIT